MDALLLVAVVALLIWLCEPGYLHRSPRPQYGRPRRPRRGGAKPEKPSSPPDTDSTPRPPTSD